MSTPADVISLPSPQPVTTRSRLRWLGSFPVIPTTILVIIALVALFAVGLGLSLFTGRDALRSAVRMVLIGGGAGAISYLVGHLVGVAIG